MSVTERLAVQPTGASTRPLVRSLSTVLPRFYVEADWSGHAVVDRSWGERVASQMSETEARDLIADLERESLKVGDPITIEGLPIVDACDTNGADFA